MGMNKQTSHLKAVEWSPSQRAFHVQNLPDMIRDNLSVFRGQSMTDYLCIGIFKTYAEAEAFLSKAYRFLNESR
jgi:hypothetical protein